MCAEIFVGTRVLLSMIVVGVDVVVDVPRVPSSVRVPLDAVLFSAICSPAFHATRFWGSVGINLRHGTRDRGRRVVETRRAPAACVVWA